MRVLRQFAAVGLLVALAISLLPAPAQAGTEYRNITFNVCAKGTNRDALCNSGTLDSARVDGFVRLIANYTPYVVGFQEICEDTLVAIRQRLAIDYGFQMYSYFGPTQSISRSQGAACFFGASSTATVARAGNGILVRRPFNGGNPLTTYFQNQDPNSEDRRNQICVDSLTPDSVSQRNCTLHLTNRVDIGVTFQQQLEVADSLKEVDQNRFQAIVMTGDFNLNCDSVSRAGDCAPNAGEASTYNTTYAMYQVADEGDSFDSDPYNVPNSATFSSDGPVRKIDYLFHGRVTRSYALRTARSVVPQDAFGRYISDHRMIVGYEAMR